MSPKSGLIMSPSVSICAAEFVPRLEMSEIHGATSTDGVARFEGNSTTKVRRRRRTKKEGGEGKKKKKKKDKKEEEEEENIIIVI